LTTRNDGNQLDTTCGYTDRLSKAQIDAVVSSNVRMVTSAAQFRLASGST
jgi:hypothetical protein